MSLETEIRNLTAAVENLAFIIKQMNVIQKSAAPNPVVVDTKEPILAPSAAIVAAAPEPVAPIVATAPVVAMPPMPTFMAPTPAPQPAQVTHGKAPFSDAKGLMDYLMKTYTTLGAEKGAKIQEVMKSLGASAVNEVTADKYDALFAGVEALK